MLQTTRGLTALKGIENGDTDPEEFENAIKAYTVRMTGEILTGEFVQTH